MNSSRHNHAIEMPGVIGEAAELGDPLMPVEVDEKTSPQETHHHVEVHISSITPPSYSMEQKGLSSTVRSIVNNQILFFGNDRAGFNIKARAIQTALSAFAAYGSARTVIQGVDRFYDKADVDQTVVTDSIKYLLAIIAAISNGLLTQRTGGGITAYFTAYESLFEELATQIEALTQRLFELEGKSRAKSSSMIVQRKELKASNTIPVRPKSKLEVVSPETSSSPSSVVTPGSSVSPVSDPETMLSPCMISIDILDDSMPTDQATVLPEKEWMEALESLVWNKVLSFGGVYPYENQPHKNSFMRGLQTFISVFTSYQIDLAIDSGLTQGIEKVGLADNDIVNGIKEAIVILCLLGLWYYMQMKAGEAITFYSNQEKSFDGLDKKSQALEKRTKAFERKQAVKDGDMLIPRRGYAKASNHPEADVKEASKTPINNADIDEDKSAFVPSQEKKSCFARVLSTAKTILFFNGAYPFQSSTGITIARSMQTLASTVASYQAYLLSQENIDQSYDKYHVETNAASDGSKEGVSIVMLIFFWLLTQKIISSVFSMEHQYGRSFDEMKEKNRQIDRRLNVLEEKRKNAPVDINDALLVDAYGVSKQDPNENKTFAEMREESPASTAQHHTLHRRHSPIKRNISPAAEERISGHSGSRSPSKADRSPIRSKSNSPINNADADQDYQLERQRPGSPARHF